MKKHSILRIFAALLVFSLCVSMLPASVFAVSGDEAPETHAATLEDFLAGSATAEDVCGVLDPSSVPEIIGYQEAAAKNHVARLYADEGTDLNKIVFLNVDGSKTMYTYDFPVKYVDEDGSIQDIRLEIADSAGESGGFETAANAAVTTFSARFSDGISLKGNHAEIQLIPVLPSASSGTGAMRANAAADATAQRIDENRIEYRYDAQTTVEYSLTYTGFKEDIVVSEYTGQTVYPFRLYTNGLGLAEIDGSFYLVNDDGSIAATIGDIIIFTADERNNTLGEIVPVTVVEKEEYLLNIVVDADYLANPDTLYPIRIDPTVEICYDNNGDGGIADVTLNSTNGSSGSSGSIYVGLRETYGISRTLMKFPGLNLGSLGNNITVTNASVEIRDLMCETTPLEVSCYVFSGNTWSESTANWSNVSPNSISTFLSSNVISYSNGTQQAVSHRYVFDITAAVEGWRTGNYNQEKGIIFKASSSAESGTTYNYKTFASYNRASNKPSLSVTYNDIADSEIITANVLKPVNISSVGARKIFKFVPTSTGFYSFESTAISSGDPYCWLYNPNQELLAYNDDGAGSHNFRLTYHFVSYQTYYLAAGCYETGTGSYSVKITQTSLPSSISSSAIAWGDSKRVSCTAAQKAVFYRYVPASTGEYLFHSTSTSGDPKVWLYDSGLTLVGTNDNSAGNSNFRLTATLTAGHTYYIVGGQSGQKTGSYVLHLLKTATVSDAIYYIKNVGTSKYIDIVGPVAQEWVHQWTAHTGLQEKWTFQRQTDGYYTIQSQYGNRYYIGISSTATGENNIKLYSGISDNTKWKIFELSSGQLILEPKTAVGKLLYAPNSNTGTVLQLSAMGLTTAIRNKWRIAYVSAFLGYHVPSKSFELMCTANTASNSTWYPLIVDSVNAWNDSMADANISLTAESSSYSIEVDSYTDSWFGLTCPITISENSLTNAEIFINSRTVSTDSNMRRSTITHEIGHLLGLKDNPPVSDNDSLMMHSRDRTLVFVPQKFDIENVDFIYN